MTGEDTKDIIDKALKALFGAHLRLGEMSMVAQMTPTIVLQIIPGDIENKYRIKFGLEQIISACYDLIEDCNKSLMSIEGKV